MEWSFENNGLKRKRQDFDFLLIKPTFHLHKIKFQKVLLNATMTMGLDGNHIKIKIIVLGEIFVWGNHQDGLLGLGYNITNVDIPTKLDSLKNIKYIYVNLVKSQ